MAGSEDNLQNDSENISMSRVEDYKKISQEARRVALQLIFHAQTSHVGSNFSCTDIFTFIFDKIDLDKDKIILSKGWAAATLYYFLWKKGRITEKELNSYCLPGSKFIGLAEPIIPEIPAAGGSMGFGLPAGVGFALAKKMNKEEGKIHVLMSDGEMQIGTTWESILIAKHHKLSNLVVWVDNNRLQAMGPTKEILDIEPLEERVKSFGWNVQRINGHDFELMEAAFNNLGGEAPHMIICDTIKGKGWKRAENNNLYHYKNISEEEYKEALAELNG